MCSNYCWPIQVAKEAAELWGFDGYYGSNYDVIDGNVYWKNC